ncbi:hypothetical protein VFPPC_16975 [Pochonia chlamydosporia 170]|uniref:Uncharacterized protein n=1 Tax=Pochonia chlamydosporia 170 TaxID=1380566 RepID=A0A179EZD3_METCM|nr:hypothetical protein VFPPC_16975 [Pochonia chlamydosporia 170]OAQ58546.1 hypothetical protein VFPPC_16975 [Pochonia chlamydosporia 170]
MIEMARAASPVYRAPIPARGTANEPNGRMAKNLTTPSSSRVVSILRSRVVYFQWLAASVRSYVPRRASM